ncbi:MAG: hypothetical protein J5819_01245 [Eubacterium sp.]|nr:hypothetical protein [Eubacterium sp.]
MKRFRSIVCLLCMLFVLVACESETEKPAVNMTPAPEDTPLPTPELETITVFTIDSAKMTTVPSRVKKIPGNDNVDYIVQLVLDNLEDSDIHISKAFMEGENAVIVFKSKSKPLKNCSFEMETLILDCFSTSVLDNVEGCRGVIFRSDKGKYTSDNLTLDEDEIYASN